mmetsp:Transcript_23593/g.65485  ORF Transcript_23593/g.65485 Transcript_23593/m.65485 type:complete len:809 (-) Transcript_23593:1694-4120(-)
MKMTDSHSSNALLNPAYFPVEVTSDEYWKMVDDEGADAIVRKKNSSYPKSMSRRIGKLLLSRRKKDITDIATGCNNDNNSLSGISNHGQLSVGNKTTDSGTTIKASNLQPEQVEMIYSTSSQTSIFVPSRQQSVHDEGDVNVKDDNDRQIRPPKSWRSLKRLVNKGRGRIELLTSITSHEETGVNAKNVFRRLHSKSHDGAISLGLMSSSPWLNTGYPFRKRIFSDGFYAPQHKQQEQQLHETKSFSGSSFSGYEFQHVMDQVIRGRYDGIDVLSLGPASRSSLPIKSLERQVGNDSLEKSSSRAIQGNKIDDNEGSKKQSLDPLYRSFTTREQYASPAKLVDEMIWASGGMDHPEVIFEGFYPGGNDRWSVCIPPPSLAGGRVTSNFKDDSTELSSSYMKTTDDNGNNNVYDSTDLPLAEQWKSLWGLLAHPPPMPSHLSMNVATKLTDGSKEECQQLKEDDEIQKIVETCYVPVDLDDDAFIIHSPQHLQSVHEHLMVPLQSRRFEIAISIFEKIKRGSEGNKQFHHLNASTNHNIGMIHLCQGHYQKALESFDKAIQIRKECLPPDHPDIAVSLQRKGIANFALGSIEEALRCFEAALAICTPIDITRVKILNNIGVTSYQLEDHTRALKSFSDALEIQRPWLQGSVRRESVVFSASIILSNMGKVHLRNGDHDLAYLVFEEAYLLQISTFRKDHDIVLYSLENMARAHVKSNNNAEALRIFSSLHRSQAARFGTDSEFCIETVGMMGRVHFKLLEYEEAEKCMKIVREWQIKQGIQRSHPSVQFTIEQIRQIEQNLEAGGLMWI